MNDTTIESAVSLFALMEEFKKKDRPEVLQQQTSSSSNEKSEKVNTEKHHCSLTKKIKFRWVY